MFSPYKRTISTHTHIFHLFHCYTKIALFGQNKLKLLVYINSESERERTKREMDRVKETRYISFSGCSWFCCVPLISPVTPHFIAEAHHNLQANEQSLCGSFNLNKTKATYISTESAIFWSMNNKTANQASNRPTHLSKLR